MSVQTSNLDSSYSKVGDKLGDSSVCLRAMCFFAHVHARLGDVDCERSPFPEEGRVHIPQCHATHWHLLWQDWDSNISIVWLDIRLAKPILQRTQHGTFWIHHFKVLASKHLHPHPLFGPLWVLTTSNILCWLFSHTHQGFFFFLFFKFVR